MEYVRFMMQARMVDNTDTADTNICKFKKEYIDENCEPENN